MKKLGPLDLRTRAAGRKRYIDLYHRTSSESAKRILKEGFGKGSEGGRVYFSTNDRGQAEGYGNTVVHVRVPKELANLDDEFPNGEQHYWVDYRDLL